MKDFKFNYRGIFQKKKKIQIFRMFCGINTAPLSVVKSVQSLLSAAEMLASTLPNISGSFINYAFLLCDDYFSKNQSTPESIESFNKLKSVLTKCKISNAKELEQFGDSILAAAEDSSLPNEMYRLAYLSYAATSIHGPASQRVNQKIKRMESKIFAQPNPQNQNIQYQQSNSQNAPIQNYPVNNNGIPQTAHPSMVTIPSYPKIDGPEFNNIPNPPQTFGYSQKPPPSNVQYPQISSQENHSQTKKTDDNNKCKQLIEIARLAFKNGSLNVAYAAMSAAIKELDKK